jgi:hypothetical protein
MSVWTGLALHRKIRAFLSFQMVHMADAQRCLSRSFVMLNHASTTFCCGVAVVVDRSMWAVIGQLENRWSTPFE